MLIANSTFANNRCLTNSGVAYIVYDDHHKGLFRVNVMKSNFTLGSKAGIDFWYLHYNEADVIFENCYFSHNIAGYEGGVYIESCGIGTIKFPECTICDNIALQYGGGLFIDMYGISSIEYCNCTIYKYTA